jgi:hypothetical protein
LKNVNGKEITTSIDMDEIKKQQKEWEKFLRIMNTPLEKVKQEDLEWAVNQDRFNSINSKGFFKQEIERRKNNLKL